MTKSKHHLWQARWTVDHAAGTYVHECGLVVRFTGPADTRGQAMNAQATQEELAVKNGHNAAAMITRMMREAAELHQHGAAARINTKVGTPTR